jgi:hypothetical protein
MSRRGNRNALAGHETDVGKEIPGALRYRLVVVRYEAKALH